MAREEPLPARLVSPIESGIIREVLPNARYRAQMPAGREVVVSLSGAMRIQAIRLLPGDHVPIEISPFDATKGRITNHKQPGGTETTSQRNETETET